MKTITAQIFFAMIIATIVIWGCECKQPDKGQVLSKKPDNTLTIPSCWVLDIGGCPYLWCVTMDGSNASTSGLATMSPTCEAQSAVVSIGKAQ